MTFWYDQVEYLRSLLDMCVCQLRPNFNLLPLLAEKIPKQQVLSFDLVCIPLTKTQ